MKICVFGAGAIGSHVAARLARGGAEVSVIARGAQLEAIVSSGITIHAPDLTFTERVAASADAHALGPQDAVLVTVKAPALPSVAAAIAPLLRADTPVAFVMNGIPWWYFHAHGGALDGRRLPRIDPQDAMWNAIGPARTLGGVVYSACTVTAPGEVEVETPRNRVILGEPDGAPSPRAEAIAACLDAGGMIGEVSGKIRERIWEKLVLNLATGPAAVLTQSPPARFLADPAIVDSYRRIVAEAKEIARALGCPVQVEAEAMLARSSKLDHIPSIAQDLMLGRPMEIDAIFDAPLQLAALCGVAAPTLALLVALAKIRARSAGLYDG